MVVSAANNSRADVDYAVVHTLSSHTHAHTHTFTHVLKVVVDLDLVNKLLSQRMQAKFQKDFGAADRVRDQLKALGVHCHDRQKTWKAVPVRGGGGRGRY